MALWGTKDTVYSTGNVNVNVTTGVVTKTKWFYCLDSR